MNPQYFGDTRDLFKIDLVCHIMKRMPSLNSFTFVPMLTDDRSKGDRKKSPKKDLGAAVRKGRAGSTNADLVTHMARLQEIDSDLEYFRGIRSLFNKENILMGVFDRVPFSHTSREQYFTAFFAEIPKKSLILLDPDIGLEERNPSKKHLLFEEVRDVFDHMDTPSILMIYQHFPRKPRGSYASHRCSQLYDLTGAPVLSLNDNEIIFFFITKSSRGRARLREVVEAYRERYPALSFYACP